MSFEVIPAIDLREGRCVRLYQGDFQRETVFAESPARMARQWQDLGATRLHVVDLEGAAAGEPRNGKALKDILARAGVPVQFGGGVRSLTTIEELLRAGVDRVILGTAAVRFPDLVQEACQRFGTRIAVSIDARANAVAVEGWQEKAALSPVALAGWAVALGVPRLIFTDIARDGTLEGPNLEAIARMRQAVKVPLLASGGVASLDHLLQVRDLGVEGVIVGRALYTGALDLPQALLALANALSR